MNGWKKLGVLALLMVLPACSLPVKRNNVVCQQMGMVSTLIKADAAKLWDNTISGNYKGIPFIYNLAQQELCVLASDEEFALVQRSLAGAGDDL